MRPGQPTADLVFTHILPAIASTYAILSETETCELRRALAALSTFKGPGTIARNIAMRMIRDELAEREGAI